MDILIKGLDLPKKGDTYGLHLSIFPNGDVYVEYDEEPTATAVALPEHGDLIERNALPIIGITDYKLESHTVVEFEDVQNAPVIVEATE